MDAVSNSTTHLPSSCNDHVAILMATYQGEQYLAEQLESLAAQTHDNWTLWVSDDGSTDATRAILDRYRRVWGDHRLQWRDGPRRGFAANFMSLVCDISIRADYFAYADQDDVWFSDKLARAVEAMAGTGPALYCSRTLLVDADGQVIGLSPGLKRPASFANALTQNIASGNTMVFDNAARSLLVTAGEHVDIPLHDWWTYLLVSGCDGRVEFDSRPSVRYRQHAANLIGQQTGWGSVWHRGLRLWRGHHQDHVQRNLDALAPLTDCLSAANRRAFDYYRASKDPSLRRRLDGLRRSGVYRQSRLGSLGMLLATILNKT